jgi:sulfate adenylyltransferase
MAHFSLNISEETLQDLINIETGLLAPLKGFMNFDDYICVVNDMLLADRKSVWTIPITLEAGADLYRKCSCGDTVHLIADGRVCGDLFVESKFTVEEEHIRNVFGTTSPAHPGVAKENNKGNLRIGGKTTIVDRNLLDGILTPARTKAYFQKSGWATIAGFQTRNPIHNAHEHLQRTALEICDAVFINPITGWKKKGDFTEEAVVSAYMRMMDEFYPKDRIFFAGLKTQMRYAGPREAIFHALIRKNLGCTHFIIGRDHAGVGGFYGAYDAHRLARELMKTHDLGIGLMLMNEPYYCKKCGFVVSSKNCAHETTHRVEISGTRIRECIESGEFPDAMLMRPEISEELLKLQRIFII